MHVESVPHPASFWGRSSTDGSGKLDHVRQRTESLLADQASCRKAWLEQAKATLAADGRIEAALLYGSFGRANADVWSDIDLIVFSNDQHVSAMVEGRLEFGDQFGTPCTSSTRHATPPWTVPR